MMTMIKSPDCNSDSSSPPHFKSTYKTISTNSKTNIPKYKPNIKSKFLRPKNKNTMQRSSPNKYLRNPTISPSYSHNTIPQLTEHNSAPPPNYNLHIFLPIIVLFVTPNYPHCLLLHTYIILLLLKILFLTTPLIIAPYTLYGNQLKFPSYSTTYEIYSIP